MAMQPNNSARLHSGKTHAKRTAVHAGDFLAKLNVGKGLECRVDCAWGSCRLSLGETCAEQKNSDCNRSYCTHCPISFPKEYRIILFISWREHYLGTGIWLILVPRGCS